VCTIYHYTTPLKYINFQNASKLISRFCDRIFMTGTNRSYFSPNVALYKNCKSIRSPAGDISTAK
jgi:hypothetical protein